MSNGSTIVVPANTMVVKMHVTPAIVLGLLRRLGRLEAACMGSSSLYLVHFSSNPLD